MRRGLIRWDADELPRDALRERLSRLRRSMRRSGFDGFVLYTNFIRCAAVSWLTGFSPYWGDGLLVVPREGEPLFTTMLSNRMAGWIQSVKPIGELVTSPNPGQIAGKRLAGFGARRIGILELNDFPAGLHADLAAALPGAELLDGTDVFRKASHEDNVAKSLLQRADEIARSALAALAAVSCRTAGDAVSLVEKSARLDGAEEIYVAVAPDLDRSRNFIRISGGLPLGRRFAIRATLAYKGNWVRRIRTCSRDPDDVSIIRCADEWFAGLLADKPSSTPLRRRIAERIPELADGKIEFWFAERAVGTRPLQIVISHDGLPEKDLGNFPTNLAMGLVVGGVPWCGAGLFRQQQYKSGRHSDLQFLSEGLLNDGPDYGSGIPLRICDALASFVAGLNSHDGQSLARLYSRAAGPSEIAAAVAAITRLSECDDIELTSCVTPGAVVIPVALAYAGENAAGVERAICRGYEAGIIIGRALGGAKALPKVWPTLIAAPVMAAVTLSFLKGYGEEQLVHAMALSLAGANGRVGRPSGTPSGRWLVFAQAVEKGIRAAQAAGQGFKGDPLLCAGDWWDLQAGHSDIDQTIFMEPLWPHIDETDFKLFPIARQAATAVEMFQNLLASGLDPKTIESVEVTVPRMNAAMLSRPAILGDRPSLLCNLGFQLACAAFAPELLYDPERRAATAALVEFSRRVTITPTDEYEHDIAFGQWPARVLVRTPGRDHVEPAGRTQLGHIGDHTEELQNKWRHMLHGEDRRDFFENVVNAPPGAHAMLWEWVKQRLAKAAKMESQHEDH